MLTGCSGSRIALLVPFHVDLPIHVVRYQCAGQERALCVHDYVVKRRVCRVLHVILKGEGYIGYFSELVAPTHEVSYYSVLHNL